MTHPRRLLRERSKAALTDLVLGDLTLNVYTNRVKELTEESLPACVILTEDETSTRASKGGDVDRTVSVTFALMIDAEASSTLDDDLDNWAEQIEERLAANPPAQRFTLVGTTLELPEPEEGERWIGFLFLEYEGQILS